MTPDRFIMITESVDCSTRRQSLRRVSSESDFTSAAPDCATADCMSKSKSCGTVGKQDVTSYVTNQITALTTPTGDLAFLTGHIDMSRIGITGHSHDAPDTHREALRRFDFRAVLTPWSYVLSQRAPFADSYRALAADCAERGVALRLIKTVARRNWPEPDDEHRYATWYEPIDDAAQIRAAVSWALAQPVVCGIATPGDVGLLAAVIAAEEDRQRETDAEHLLAEVPDLSSPFINAPF